jgi:hypothetical protein
MEALRRHVSFALRLTVFVTRNPKRRACNVNYVYQRKNNYWIDGVGRDLWRLHGIFV